MRFKVELKTAKKLLLISYIFHAKDLTELENLIKEKFPDSIIVSIIGGGCE